MGHGSWSTSDWSSYSATTRSLSRERIFSSSMKDSMNPEKIQLRESRDSTDNPRSTPITVALDVTGSMGFIAEQIAKDGLGKLFEKILGEKPVTDPHLMFMGIGDAYTDSAPLQVSQFEADIRIADQLRDLWLEGCGGGNYHESYHLAWWWVANRCQLDINARGGKGWIFTIGDEYPADTLSKSQKERIFGGYHERDETLAEILSAAQEKCHVYHIVATEGSFARRHGPDVISSWRKLLGENVLVMDDHTTLPDLICATMASVAVREAPLSDLDFTDLDFTIRV